MLFLGVSFIGFLLIPDSVTSIGENTFSNFAQLNGEPNVPKNFENIGNYATFSGCSRFNGPLSLPGELTIFGNSTLSGCSGINGPLEILSEVKTVGNHVFSDYTSLKRPLNIPNKVEKIGDCAFSSLQ